MSRCRALAAALACLLACTLATPCRGQAPEAKASAEAQPKYRIEVEAPGELKKILEQGVSLARWASDPQMTLELLRRLAAEATSDAVQAAATEGYFSAQASYAIDEMKTPWIVTLKVDPGERTLVQSVQIDFAGPVTQDPRAGPLLNEVRKEWALRAGAPFTRAAWEEAKNKAVRKLASWRYAAAKLATSHAQVDSAAHRATLSLTLDSGPAFRFGEVEVRGTQRHPAGLVSDFAPQHPGEEYTRQALDLYVQRLIQSGYFASARAEIVADPARADAAPVQVSVIEASAKQFEAGLSYNTDHALRLELTQRNSDVAGSGWREQATVRWDADTEEARLSLDTPPSPDATWRSHFVNFKHSTIQNEEVEETSVGVTYNWAGAGSPSSLIASGHFDRHQVSGGPVDRADALYLGFRRAFRKTDELLQPRKGYFGNVTAGFAPGEFATQAFQRVTAQGTALFALGRNDDLMLRAEGGRVFAPSRDGIPSSFLFRTGGDQTVRGYAFEGLGVKVGDAVVGGRALLIGTVEATHWYGAWGVAGFVDAGNAWDGGKFDPAFGIGAGLRFRTPVGPVRLDLAYGQQEHTFRLHFSVGFVF
jgi:translocation and assembly module TamA